MANICEAFHRNPTINPRTGRQIKIGGATYNALVKECGSPYMQPVAPQTRPYTLTQYLERMPITPIVPRETREIPIPKPIISTIPIVPKPTIPKPITPTRLTQLLERMPITPAVKIPIPNPISAQRTLIPIPKPTSPQRQTATIIQPTFIPNIPELPAIPQINQQPVRVPSPQITQQPVRLLSPRTTQQIEILNVLTVEDVPIGTYGVSQEQQRASEDRYQIKQVGPFRYFAVFDGHGGTKRMGPDHVADYAANHLHERLAEALTPVNLNIYDDVIEAIKQTFVRFDTEMHDSGKLYGSTCTIIMIDDDRQVVYQINLGDSRSIIFNEDGIISATENHDPKNTIERGRIEKAGGFVYLGRVNGILSVSRAFGDFELKEDENYNIPYDPVNGKVSAVPDVKIVPMPHPLYAILTSDAPYERDAFNDEQLVEMFWTGWRAVQDTNDPFQEIAIFMVHKIVPRTTDDTTIIVI